MYTNFSGHLCFNTGLKLKSEANSNFQTNGIFEHLLIHTLALACTLNYDEITFLEQNLYEAILSLDCYSALFSSNLWRFLAR